MNDGWYVNLESFYVILLSGLRKHRHIYSRKNWDSSPKTSLNMDPYSRLLRANFKNLCGGDKRRTDHIKPYKDPAAIQRGNGNSSIKLCSYRSVPSSYPSEMILMMMMMMMMMMMISHWFEIRPWLFYGTRIFLVNITTWWAGWVQGSHLPIYINLWCSKFTHSNRCKYSPVN